MAVAFSVGREIFDSIAAGSKTVFHLHAELFPDAAKFASSFPGSLSFLNRDNGQKVTVWVELAEADFDISHVPIGQFLADLDDQDEHIITECPDEAHEDSGGGVAIIAPPVVATTAIKFARVPNPDEKIVRLSFLTPDASRNYLAR